MKHTFCALALALATVHGQVLADPAPAAPARLPVATFFKDAEIGSAQLSPNGRYLATTARKSGNLQLAVLDLETSEAKVLAGYTESDIANVLWIDNDRLAYSIIDRSFPNNAPRGLFTVARSGGKQVMVIGTHPGYDLTYTSIYAVRPVARSHKDPRKMLAIGYIADGADARPLEVDVVSGRRNEIAFDLPGKPLDFLFDGQDQVRAATTTTGEDMQTTVIWYRDSGSTPWRKLVSFPSLDLRFGLVGMVGDDLYVTAPAGSRMGLYKYDVANNKLGELVLADQDADVEGGLVFAPDTRQLLGIRVPAEPPRTHWFDAGYASLQRSLDKAYPNRVNLIMPGETNAPRLIMSYSSTDPGRYLRYDPATRKVSLLFAARPWIDPAQMAEQLVFDYKARDGLPIMAYLTVPKGSSGKGLPLIVMPHGGPHARDYWGFAPDVQFLANRGYAVLQPQFRGSDGFGIDHLKKGFRQWGLAMQDDINDGVRTLVEQGLADPKRVCIMGASYGGYAAMIGLERDPAMYRCGVNLLGVTDLASLLAKGSWRSESFRYGSKVMIADQATMKAQIEATSPVLHAADIRAPVLMAYGEKDRRVPIDQGTDMRDALKKAGKTYEWMSFSNEEHGLSHEDNRLKVYSAIDAFLARYNPAQ